MSIFILKLPRNYSLGKKEEEGGRVLKTLRNYSLGKKAIKYAYRQARNRDSISNLYKRKYT
jgi:hypothetical protein